MWKDVLAEQPHHPRAYGGLAAEYIGAGRYREGVAYAERARELEPKALYPYMLLGAGELALNRPDRAIEYLHWAVRSGFRHPQLFLLLGDAYQQKGWLEKAADTYDQSLALQPVQPVLVLQAAQLNHQLGRIGRARELARFALTIGANPPLATSVLQATGGL